MAYSIGVDFGTLSVRAALVQTTDGQVIARSEYIYPHGILTSLPDGTKLPEDSAYAHPEDYMEGLKSVINGVLSSADIKRQEVVAIGVDATSCSVLPINESGMPLCLLPQYKNRAHAYIKLWKHHSARPYAARLQQVAEELSSRFLPDCGNKISSEVYFPKVLETYEQDPEIFGAAYTFLEVGEWITLLLTGVLTTSEPTACVKRFYHPFRGYPSTDYFDQVVHAFGINVQKKLKGKFVRIGAPVGTLHPRMATMFGLSDSVVVGCSVVDAHAAVAAVGGTNGDIVNVMGTSGVTLLCSHNDTGMDGIYSAPSNLFLPGLFGHEGGQSSVGDTFDWFIRTMVPMETVTAAAKAGKSIHEYLSDGAARLSAGQSGLLGLNWNNGVRTPLMDPSLSSVLLGITNRTTTEEMYRAMFESVAFGTRHVKEIFEQHGHKINRIFLTGGIPRKNRLFCDIFTDVIGKEVLLCKEENACAVGSAVLGAIAWKPSAQADLTSSMSSRSIERLTPDIDAKNRYQALFAEYVRLADYMGGYESILHRVRDVKKAQTEKTN